VDDGFLPREARDADVQEAAEEKAEDEADGIEEKGQGHD
jgi:hypothetical protein